VFVEGDDLAGGIDVGVLPDAWAEADESFAFDAGDDPGEEAERGQDHVTCEVMAFEVGGDGMAPGKWMVSFGSGSWVARVIVSEFAFLGIDPSFGGDPGIDVAEAGEGGERGKDPVGGEGRAELGGIEDGAVLDILLELVIAAGQPEHFLEGFCIHAGGVFF